MSRNALNYISMKSKIITLIVFLCCIQNGIAQKITISGYVKDSKTGESLIGVTVYNTNSKGGTACNLYGFYSLSVPIVDTLGLVFSYMGYQTQIKKITTKENFVLNISMEAKASEMKEVVINGNRNNNNVQKPQMGVIDIPIQQIKNVSYISLVNALEPCTTTIRFTLQLRKVPIGLLKEK